MWKYKNIINLEKKKIFSKIKIKKKIIKKFKKLRIWIKGKGCEGLKYEIKIEKKLKKNDIIIQIKKFFLVSDNISYIYIYGSLIKYKKKFNNNIINIIHPNIEKTCKCGNSYKLK